MKKGMIAALFAELFASSFETLKPNTGRVFQSPPRSKTKRSKGRKARSLGSRSNRRKVRTK